jgi:hypothetical protein
MRCCQLPRTRNPIRWVLGLPLCVKAWIIAYIVLLLMAGCVPAETRIDLDATPGPPVVITEDRYTTTAFSVTYPTAWRVVTSPTFAAPWVVFVRPDEAALIALAVEGDDIADLLPESGDELRDETRAVGAGLTARLVAPADDWDAALATFERVIGSL